MLERRRKFDAEFREGAVRLVHETGKSIAQIARDLGINEGTLGNWVVRDRASRNGADGLSHDDLAELKRREGYENVEVRARAMVSLNGREPQLLIDPNVDLAKEDVGLLPVRWIVPLTTPLRSR